MSRGVVLSARNMNCEAVVKGGV